MSSETPSQDTSNLGRPEEYTPEKGELICEELALGKSLREVCADNPELPNDKRSIFRWLYRHEDFCHQYLRAKQFGMYAKAEELEEIADDGTNDYMEREGKDPVVDHEAVQRSKLRVQTRQWMLERLAPKRFGQKVDLNHGGQADNPIGVLIQQVAGSTLRPTEDGAADGDGT